MKLLSLGAGKQRFTDYEHQDRLPFQGIDHWFDLNDDVWPLEFDHYDKVICYHCVEHLDSLIHFMDRVWCILKPNGILEIATPNAGMNPDLTNCDPTHKMCYRPGTFENYFTPHGIEKFGYTNKAWKMDISTYNLELPNDCIRVIATPIK